MTSPVKRMEAVDQIPVISGREASCLVYQASITHVLLVTSYIFTAIAVISVVKSFKH